MPEVDFSVRWADGALFEDTAPSRAIERFICAGGVYPQGELVRRLLEGLHAASERVRERYGVACTQAAETADAVRTVARGLDPLGLACVERVARRGGALSYPPPADGLDGHVDVVVVGGGQAGLATSWYLTELGVEHVVLERDVVASSWRRERWDSFCLVTPNFQCRLPTHSYPGSEPDGFMLREEIVRYVEEFADSLSGPVYEGVSVVSVDATGAADGFVVRTSHGTLACDQVVLCVGGYHRPRPAPGSGRLDPSVTQLHSSTYRNPGSIPDGGVLVVGSGQSGAQITEDLLRGGRDVHLSVGSAPRVARFYRGRDSIAWLEEIGHYRMPIDEHPDGLAARKEPNHYMTGRDGGHDIDLRAFALDGLTLHGRLSSVDDGVLSFAGDLAANLDAADATMDRIKTTIDGYIARRGLSASVEERYAPVWHPDGDGSAPLDLAASGVRTIVWATGFVSDWSFVSPPLLDENGYPAHHRGVCSRVPGIYVLGLPWLWTWGSGRFASVAQDAEFVAGAVAERIGARSPRRSAA